MSDTLATAIEEARSRLLFGVQEAEAELERARARARALRVSLVMARELTGIGGSIEITQREGGAPRVAADDRSSVEPARSAVALPPGLSLRRRVALEVLRAGRPPTRLRASFSPGAVLRWDGDSPLAGTYAGRKEALAFLELVLLEIEPSVDPQPRIVGEGAALRIDARPALRGERAVRISLRVVVEFDGRDRIERLSVTPEAGAPLDRLVESVLA
ncbi:MAG: hypothetical protein ACM3OO_00595 [Planctomycetaceae bacterium]